MMTMLEEMLLSLHASHEFHGNDPFTVDVDDTLLTVEPIGLRWGEILRSLQLLEFSLSEYGLFRARVTEEGTQVLLSPWPIELYNPYPIGSLVKVLYKGNRPELIFPRCRVLFVRTNGRDGLYTDAVEPYTVKVEDERFPQLTGILSASLGRIGPADTESKSVTWEIAREKEKTMKKKGRAR